jgi:NTP pyrophosphatase (non-canonical NTP hydrolase)
MWFWTGVRLPSSPPKERCNIKKGNSKFIDDLDMLTKKLAKEQSIEKTMICTIEEVSEVTKIITKYLRQSEKFSIEDLTQEVAHALLMLDTVKNVFNIQDEEINKHKLMALKKCFKY